MYIDSVKLHYTEIKQKANFLSILFWRVSCYCISLFRSMGNDIMSCLRCIFIATDLWNPDDSYPQYNYCNYSLQGLDIMYKHISYSYSID